MGVNSQAIRGNDFPLMWNPKAFGVESAANFSVSLSVAAIIMSHFSRLKATRIGTHMAAVLLEVRDVVSHWGSGIPGREI
jgi:hypothetical protein